MKNKLFNPFIYIAGTKALIIGLLAIVTATFIGFYSRTHFPDAISVKVSYHFPFLYFLIQGFVNWFVVSIVLYLFAKVFSKSKVRIVDVFGTQAMARFPYFIAAFTGFSKSIKKFGDYLLYANLGIGNKVEISTFEMGMAIFLIVLTLLLTVWMITLMYNAYKVSANLKSTRLVLTFIAGLILSIILSGLFNYQLIKFYS